MQGVARMVSGSGSSETFSFRVSMTPPDSELVAWLRSDEREVVYCRGYVLLRETPAVKLVQAWQREGLVTFKQRKSGAVTEWIAEKIAGSSAPAAPANPTLGRIASMQAEALFKLLRDAALAGGRCPTKTAMAKAVTGLDDQRARNRVTYLRKRLEAEGRIAWAEGTHARAPVVTILARGKGCGLSTAADNQVLEGDL